MLKLDKLSVTVGNFVLREVSLEVERGDYFVLLGASGAGKSVLLETLAGHHVPSNGTIRLDGRDVTHAPIQKRGLALVYQDRLLFPHLSVRANIGYGLRCRGLPRADMAARVRDVAAQVGATHLLARYPATLSGGEAQRVALAHVLAISPLCLLLDEPLSSLDAGPRDDIRALLRDLNRMRNITCLHVTHDFEEALSLASRVAIMDNGRIRREGAPEDVFRDPRSEFEARMAGIRNFYRGTLRRSSGGEAEFVTGGLSFVVLTDAPPSEGYMMLAATDVIVSTERTETSARNCLKGTVLDIARGRHGIDVTVDVGVKITAVVTQRSVEKLSLERGRPIWASFKASAARWISA